MGFDLASMVIFSPHFLNCKSGDVYVDADGGRGNTAIVCKLVSPDTRAVSVEIDESRHEAAKDWLERIIRWKVDEKGNEKKPELMNLTFLDDSLDNQNLESAAPQNHV
jgi:hypothetical protein